MLPMSVNSKTKYIVTKILSLAIVTTFTACDHRDNNSVGPRDYEPPPIPAGVSTITMDEAVLVTWNAIIMDPDYDDLAGFKIYRSLNNSIFDRIGTVGADQTEFLDETVENGITYYYAVASFDDHGNESDLSIETVYDTPRPEGQVILYTFTDPNYVGLSGFDFSLEERVAFDSPSCDFYLEFDDTPSVQSFFIWVPSGARIQDMGFTDSFDDITFAPETGWSAFQDLEAIIGHTYVIRTANDHYAKVRVTEYAYDPTYNMHFDWGYQIDQGNRELKVVPVAKTADRSN